MLSWRDRGRGGGSTNLDGTGTAAGAEGDVSLPLGPGEWDDWLGLPLCVVCQNVSTVSRLPFSPVSRPSPVPTLPALPVQDSGLIVLF